MYSMIEDVLISRQYVFCIFYYHVQGRVEANDLLQSTCKLNKRDTRVPTPWYFSGIPTETLSDICSCMVTKPLPTAVATQTVSRVVTSTTAVSNPLCSLFILGSLNVDLNRFLFLRRKHLLLLPLRRRFLRLWLRGSLLFMLRRQLLLGLLGWLRGVLERGVKG